MIRVRDGESEAVLSMDEFEHRARRGEISPHALVSIPALTGEQFVEARALPLFAAVYDPRRLLFRRHFHLGRVPFVTLVVAALCIALWWVAKEEGGGAVTREALLWLGAKARARVVDDGQTWRLLVASLLHKDGTHLAFNLFALLSVGTVLEGVYRRGDYLLLLVLSGLSCMVTSTLAIPLTTVGASGMIFGCLGCAVVFGLRFADVLAWRYRIYFGVVVVGYTAAAFSLGLLRASTDNWGHAGGIVCGFLAGCLLEPRLLRLKTVTERPLTVARPWLTVVAVIGITCAIGPLLPRLLVTTVSSPFAAFGVVVERPSTWSKGTDPLGFIAFGNGVDAIASVACARMGVPKTLDEAAKSFVDDELWPRARNGQLASLVVDVPQPALVGSLPARLLPFSYVASDGPFSARALLFVRGEIECAVVAEERRGVSPVARAQLDALLLRVSVTATDAELQATRATTDKPTSTKAWLERGLAHQTAGDVDAARAAFVKAGELAREEPSWTARTAVARAAFELTFGHDLDAALQNARTAESHAKDDADAAALLVQVHRARGETDLAGIALTVARARFPDDERFK
ncbi:MAG: rhomboid family intramembrane serine protease [Deltaproteobacteria bacterium]|nr:rhomboid family intramembrane serine protease [Deltaproteobacteria bacterium]